ncbi:hypothetical protein FRC17_009411 [Serendipita sp. 399]|nr:hypothetical protein FRC17_009411 [Serendipita sp. 399]
MGLSTNSPATTAASPSMQPSTTIELQNVFDMFNGPDLKKQGLGYTDPSHLFHASTPQGVASSLGHDLDEYYNFHDAHDSMVITAAFSTQPQVQVQAASANLLAQAAAAAAVAAATQAQLHPPSLTLPTSNPATPTERDFDSALFSDVFEPRGGVLAEQVFRNGPSISSRHERAFSGHTHSRHSSSSFESAMMGMPDTAGSPSSSGFPQENGTYPHPSHHHHHHNTHHQQRQPSPALTSSSTPDPLRASNNSPTFQDSWTDQAVALAEGYRRAHLYQQQQQQLRYQSLMSRLQQDHPQAAAMLGHSSYPLTPAAAQDALEQLQAMIGSAAALGVPPSSFSPYSPVPGSGDVFSYPDGSSSSGDMRHHQGPMDAPAAGGLEGGVLDLFIQYYNCNRHAAEVHLQTTESVTASVHSTPSLANDSTPPPPPLALGCGHGHHGGVGLGALRSFHRRPGSHPVHGTVGDVSTLLTQKGFLHPSSPQPHPQPSNAAASSSSSSGRGQSMDAAWLWNPTTTTTTTAMMMTYQPQQQQQQQHPAPFFNESGPSVTTTTTTTPSAVSPPATSPSSVRRNAAAGPATKSTNKKPKVVVESTEIRPISVPPAPTPTPTPVPTHVSSPLPPMIATVVVPESPRIPLDVRVTSLPRDKRVLFERACGSRWAGSTLPLSVSAAMSSKKKRTSNKGARGGGAAAAEDDHHHDSGVYEGNEEGVQQATTSLADQIFLESVYALVSSAELAAQKEIPDELVDPLLEREALPKAIMKKGSRGGAAGYHCLWAGCNKPLIKRFDHAKNHIREHCRSKPHTCGSGLSASGAPDSSNAKGCNQRFLRFDDLKRHQKNHCSVLKSGPGRRPRAIRGVHQHRRGAVADDDDDDDRYSEVTGSAEGGDDDDDYRPVYARSTQLYSILTPVGDHGDDDDDGQQEQQQGSGAAAGAMSTHERVARIRSQRQRAAAKNAAATLTAAAAFLREDGTSDEDGDESALLPSSHPRRLQTSHVRRDSGMAMPFDPDLDAEMEDQEERMPSSTSRLLGLGLGMDTSKRGSKGARERERELQRASAVKVGLIGKDRAL